MNAHRQHFIRWIGTLLLLGCGLAQAADIAGLRVSTEDGRTRAVIELSAAVDYKLFTLANPDRIVLDLRQSRFAPDFEAKAGGGLLKGVRAGRQGKADARIVFDLGAGARPKSFLLPPKDKAGHRLVVDLEPLDGAAAAVPVRSATSPLPARPRDVIIAIDAGHGGKDPGSIGASGTHEKGITLAVARELKAVVDATPGLKAVLTRDGDHELGLHERYAKARAAKADLFISIHADAFTNSDARGSSVWVLSPRGATNEAARWLADRENRADLVGGVSLDDKDDTLAKVLLDLSQGATMGVSNAVAEHVLRSLARLGPTHRNYVERANFVVLRSPDVPSILVETAFITNPAEEARLTNPEHRKKLARAILEGVVGYFRESPPTGSLYALERERSRSGSATARYVVTRGDTLSAIAARHGISTAQLRAANGRSGERVRVGEVLQIPSS